MSFRSELKVKHYLMINLIAEGGMGVVWRAWDEKHKIFVAVKAVNNALLEDPEFKCRFIDEMGRHAKLVHPNIVQVLDAFEYGGMSCCVMEYIEGPSLEDLLDRVPSHWLDIKQVEQIAKDILAALDYSHRQGIIHRDIKPSNILLDQHGRARLIDFGIALAIGELRRTRTGQTIGTPFYMSPEQIRTPKKIDHLSDVYSLGCVLYEALAGRPPFTGNSGLNGDVHFDIKRAHIQDTPVPIRQIRSTIPVYLNNLIMTALDKEPEKRPSGCGDFMRQLAGKSKKVPPISVVPKDWKQLLAIFAMSIIVACIATLVASVTIHN